MVFRLETAPPPVGPDSPDPEPASSEAAPVGPVGPGCRLVLQPCADVHVGDVSPKKMWSDLLLRSVKVLIGGAG